MLTIVTTPDPILVKKAKAVTRFDHKLQEIIIGMEEALVNTQDPEGVGLAAPQVGISLQIFQMRPHTTDPVETFINPKIVKTSGEMEILHKKNSEKVEAKKPQKGKLLEGCLSIPTIWGYVKRNKSVTLSWQDMLGKKHKKTFTGFKAVVIQHEVDHLHGILFTKHVMSQGNQLYKSRKDVDGEDIFDEVSI